MKFEMHGQMRMEQKMKLAPQMIQSMEILQLPLLALEERIEQELASNPVLELEEPHSSETSEISHTSDSGEDDSFGSDRRQNREENFKEYAYESGSVAPIRRNDDGDRKLEALNNTEARGQSLADYLLDQWALTETGPAVKKAGETIIGYIDERGYLTVRLEQLCSKDKTEFTFEDLQKALSLVQTLEPAGVGARDIKECLLIQMKQSGKDMSFECRIISECMTELLENRLPDIAKKLKCSVDDIKAAIERISRFDTSPGLQIGKSENHPIRVEVIVEPLENADGFSVRLADSNYQGLHISEYYSNVAKDKNTSAQAKEFLQKNIRSAQWIISAIEQRKNTLLKVSESIVKNQREFFEKGQLHLKPLPMSKVADEVGIHLATVSRAVADKYVQCSWGILPLRKFFSGGTEDSNGSEHSWDAIRAKLQEFIDGEDKTKPLSDDLLLKKLNEAGMAGIARRTVAKYRKLMNIPTARLRKRY